MPLRVGILVCLLAGLAGCRCTSPGCPPRVSATPCAFLETTLPAPPPDVTAMVADAVEQAGSVKAVVGPVSRDLLDQATCQCQAAANADVAALLEQERYFAGVLAGCESGKKSRAFALARNLLAFRIVEKRNTQAGEALQLFFRLGGAEAQRHWLQRGLDETAAALERIERIESKGLPLPDGVDAGALLTQLQSLRDEAEQLALLEAQLNLQLRRLLGCGDAGHRRFAIDIDWRPDLSPPMIDLAVAEATAHRSELRLIRHMHANLEKGTLPLARATVQSADGALGAVQPLSGLLSQLRCSGNADDEIAVRGRQLRRLLSDGKRGVAAEVRAAGAAVTTQQARVRIALESVEIRRAELNTLEARRDVDRVSIFEIGAARGRLYRAEAELVGQVVDLKAAQAALRTAGGGLAAECGHAARLCRLPE